MDFDVLVIGSGFGGSVSALRLSERGYRLAVLEQGRRFEDDEIQKMNDSTRALFWMPRLGLNGCFTQQFFRHVTIVGGIGMGGGSLVYAAVLLEPKKAFYQDPGWAGTGVDWETALSKPFQTAKQMLGVSLCPTRHTQDHWLEQTARRMGVWESYGPVPLGIYFGAPEEAVDPYFGGEGPKRSGCTLCGACLAGCAKNAKNSLDKNYLYLAERKGARILTRHKATLIRRVEGGYEVESVDPLDPRRTARPTLKARWVVISAGVLGTLELLFRSRTAGTLANLSPMLGKRVRTNSEAITAVLSEEKDIDLSEGPAISSDFHPDDYTHITQNRVPPSYGFMKLYASPLVDGNHPLQRAFHSAGAFLAHPLRSTASLRTKDWHKRITLIATMQNRDNQMEFGWGRDLFTGLKTGLVSRQTSNTRTPTYLPEANQAASFFAEVSGGIPHNSFLESVLNMSVTAHILGGCVIGASPELGVIDDRHEVYGHPGLYVVDGSALPANVGVNPSLTITALAERAMSLFTGDQANAL